MYHERSAWSLVTNALAIAAGCGTDSALSVRTRSGCQAASAHPTMPPQSCPTTCALPSSAASSSARTSAVSSRIR